VEIEYSSLKSEAKRYWRWSEKRVDEKIPMEIALQGAGSEKRTPLMHYGAVLPVYLAVLRYLKKIKLKKIKLLELGCGTGRMLAFLKSEVPEMEIWGSDYTPECIKYAKDNFQQENLNFIVSNAQKTLFKRNSFDVVISSHVIEHLEKKDGRKFLEEARDLVKDGGIVMIGTPERDHCQGVYTGNVTDIKSGRLVPPHLHEYKKDELLNLAGEVYGKRNVKIDLLVNPLFMRIFRSGVEKIKPGRWSNAWYCWIRDKIPRNMFDTIIGTGNLMNLFFYKVSYKDILFDNIVMQNKEGIIGDNLLLVCQK